LEDSPRGMERIQSGLAAYRQTGAQLWAPYFLGLLGDQLVKAGRVQEGLDVIEQALAHAEYSGERYSFAELYRLKGEFIIKAGEQAQSDTSQRKGGKLRELPPYLAEAQSCFEKAIEIAQQQKARAWEERARSSMERLTALL